MKIHSKALSEFNPADSAVLESLKKSNFLKWNGAVELYQTGLPTNDALLLDPRDGKLGLALKIFTFGQKARANGAVGASMRYDHPYLPPQKYSSGHLDLKGVAEIRSLAERAFAEGWAPSLFAFDNFRTERSGAATICFVSKDEISIEMVGPGYDVADIAKGHIIPPISITMKRFAPSFMELAQDLSHMPFYLDIQDEARVLAPEELRLARANRLAARIAFLATTDGISVNEERRRLEESGRTLMFTQEATVGFAQVAELFKDATTYAEFMTGRGKSYVNKTLGLHIGNGGRYVVDNIWDEHKFGDVEKARRAALNARKTR
ncbi:MAG: hypothetical protein LBL52_02440 [Rickettsiales bacterium]|jgi:hypothetical protein|nr:hypothetical protein [Rickettsiales bacterium]